MIIFAARPLNALTGQRFTRLFSAPDEANMALTVEAVKLHLECPGSINVAFLDEPPVDVPVTQLGSEVVA